LDPSPFDRGKKRTQGTVGAVFLPRRRPGPGKGKQKKKGGPGPPKAAGKNQAGGRTLRNREWGSREQRGSHRLPGQTVRDCLL